MAKLDYLMWGIAGLLLAVFMPVGLIMTVFLVIRYVNQMIYPQEKKLKGKMNKYEKRTLEELR